MKAFFSDFTEFSASSIQMQTIGSSIICGERFWVMFTMFIRFNLLIYCLIYCKLVRPGKNLVFEGALLFLATKHFLFPSNVEQKKQQQQS